MWGGFATLRFSAKMGKLIELQPAVQKAYYSTTSAMRHRHTLIQRGASRMSKAKVPTELRKSLESSTGKSWSLVEIRKVVSLGNRGKGVLSFMMGKELINYAVRALPVDLFHKLQSIYVPSPAHANGAASGSRAHSTEPSRPSGSATPSPTTPPSTSTNTSDVPETDRTKAEVRTESKGEEDSNSTLASAQHLLTDIYSKAVDTTVAAKDMLFKNPFVGGGKLKPTDKTAAASRSSTDNTGMIDVPHEPADSVDKVIVNEDSVKSDPIQVKTVKPDQGGPNDWGLDPDMKPYLQDVNLEWKFVEARTKYLVSKLGTFDTIERTGRINLIDELYKHLLQYREARVKACEEGAVRKLVKVLKKDEDSFICNQVREILAVLGENPPTKGQGIRVLSIDGGGVRGLVAIEVLRMMETLTGKRIHEIFDYICGVSTGSILAFLLGVNRCSLDECEALYKQLSIEIFNQNSILGASSLLWNHSYYNTATWEKILKKHIGENGLLSLARDPTLPRVASISTIVSQESVFPYVFRTYGFKPHIKPRYAGGSRHEMWQAVRASAAAPTYFEEIKLGNLLHQDGGVLVNNPASVAITEAKTIWQAKDLQSVVSIGTGQTFSSRKDPLLEDLYSASPASGPNSLSWKGKFLKVLDSATDTESVHYTLTELLPSHVYFRFNPYLTEMISMDEAKKDRLEQLQKETQDYLLRNIEKVEYCCSTLSKEKGVANKVIDWWKHV